ncbi:MAG: hypothetical protein ABIJ05_01410 [Patescibacteria group bacterium]
MIIESIKLTNFRQYQDVDIMFTKPDKNKSFTIIQAPNGVGKSNFFNAIIWCLYDKEIYLTKEDKRLPLINTIALKENDGNSEVKVEIKMRDEKDRPVFISREQNFYYDQERKIKKAPSKLKMVREINKNMIVVSEPEYILSQLMPETIKEYFFFDGERLDNYFKKEGAESIKNAVFKISQIDLLDKIIIHLSEKRQSFVRENKNLTPVADKIRQEIESASKALETSKQDLDEKNRFLVEGKKNIKEILEKIRKNPIKNAKDLKEQRINLEEEVKEYEDKIKELELDFEESLVNLAPKILIHNAIENTKEIIEEKEKRKEIPPGITDKYIRKLLEKKECICGRILSNKDGSEDNLKELLNRYKNLSDLGSILLNIKTDIEIIFRENSKFKETYLNYEKTLRELEKKREEKSKLLKKTIEKLSLSDESFAKYEGDLESFNTEIENINMKIGELKASIVNSEQFIKSRNEALDDELKKEKKFNLLRRKRDLCAQTLEIAERMKKEIMEETKEEIEKRTKEQFFQLIWNPSAFKDVKIDEDYTLSVIHASGLEALGSLSAGQRQVLALSFISAINGVSGFNLPIIVDTPLGRISKDTRSNIAQKLPNFLKNKQVVMLVTDEEYTTDVRKKLGSYVGKEYEIKLKEFKNGGIAKIIEK